MFYVFISVSVLYRQECIVCVSSAELMSCICGYYVSVCGRLRSAGCSDDQWLFAVSDDRRNLRQQWHAQFDWCAGDPHVAANLHKRFRSCWPWMWSFPGTMERIEYFLCTGTYFSHVVFGEDGIGVDQPSAQTVIRVHCPCNEIESCQFTFNNEVLWTATNRLHLTWRRGSALGRRSPAGGFSLFYAWSMVDMWSLRW